MGSIATPSRRRRRALLGAALAVAAVPAVVISPAISAVDPVTACPDKSAPCVIVNVVRKTKGDPTLLKSYAVNIDENADLVADGGTFPYKTRAKKGGPTKPVPSVGRALSIEKILASGSVEVGDEDGKAKFSETRNAADIRSVLPPEYLDGSHTFPGGLVPAVYVAPGGGVGYVRPLADRNDVNAGDAFIRPAAKPLVLTIMTTGDLLSVSIKASPKKITTSAPVSFSADVRPRSDALTYRWNFTGGTKTEDKTATPSYTFTRRGNHAVNLEVMGDDGSYGRAATKVVSVGKPPKPPATGGGGGAGGGTGGGGYGGGGTGP